MVKLNYQRYVQSCQSGLTISFNLLITSVNSGHANGLTISYTLVIERLLKSAYNELSVDIATFIWTNYNAVAESSDPWKLELLGHEWSRWARTALWIIIWKGTSVPYYPKYDIYGTILFCKNGTVIILPYDKWKMEPE